MAARDSKKAVLLAFITVSFILSRNGVEGRRRLSKEEDMELYRQLKLINKPAVKSIQTEHGDFLDCVDIYKQLAFDHPLLNNHTIQMRPKSIPKGMMDKDSMAMTSSQFMLKDKGCPPGTVVIKRAQKEDLIMAKYISSLGRKYPTNIPPLGSKFESSGHHAAVLEMTGENYGAKAHLNAWGPKVSIGQFSFASIWALNGDNDQTNIIQAGWGVNQYLYQNFTRLLTYWTADNYQKTGCFNTLCPGFIQVSTQIPIGLILRPVSTYDGPQYEIALSVYRDHSMGNWWLVFGDEHVGYWPKSIFTSLANGASKVAWGGEVSGPLMEASPPMGSGHFPQEGFNRSCFINRIQVADQSENFINPDDDNLSTFSDDPSCYNIMNGGNRGDEWGNFIYFGGPGLCKIS